MKKPLLEPTNQSYFAPSASPTPGAPSASPVQEEQWGDDAAEIARLAGLGSYGPELEAQRDREDALIGGLERTAAAIGQLRIMVWLLIGAVVVITLALVVIVNRLPTAAQDPSSSPALQQR